MAASPIPLDRHPDHFLRLQEQMADPFSKVAEQAVRTGWSAEEVAAALVELADNYMLMVLANRDLASDLADLKI